MRSNLTAAVVAAGLCLLAGWATADVVRPIAESTRYTAKRGSSNMPNPQPVTITECETRVKAAIEEEARTRTTGAITYQCITTHSYSVIFKAAPVTDTATLSWIPPTLNSDGSALTNLAGYRIHYGSSPEALTQTVQIASPTTTRYELSNLSPGTYYFAVRAYRSDGVESELSRVVTKVVM